MRRVFVDSEAVELAPFRSLKVRHSKKNNIFIVESKAAVLSLLKTGLEIISCLTTPEVYESFCKKTPAFKKLTIPAYLLKRDEIEKLIGFRFHQGILAAVASPKRKNFSQVFKAVGKPHLFVALNGVHDPQNVGMIIRNATAFAADAVIVDRLTCEPYYRKVVRVSMGSIFNTKIAYEDNLAAALSDIRKKSALRVIVPLLKGAECDIGDVDFSGDICFVFGNEADGASKDIMRLADVAVRIPHCFKNIQSLNVACASAIFLHEAYRQRKGKVGQRGLSVKIIN